MNKSTGKVVIEIKDGYKVFFDKEKTFRKELGFKEEVLTSTTIADNYVDILKTVKIFIHCNIISGSYFNGKLSDILFSFPNNKKFGAVISYQPNPFRKKLLSKKRFNQIRFDFKNQNGEGVDFLGSQVGLTLEIKEI